VFVGRGRHPATRIPPAAPTQAPEQPLTNTAFFEEVPAPQHRQDCAQLEERGHIANQAYGDGAEAEERRDTREDGCRDKRATDSTGLACPTLPPIANRSFSTGRGQNAPGVMNVTGSRVIANATNAPLSEVTCLTAGFSSAVVMPQSALTRTASPVPGWRSNVRSGAASPPLQFIRL
jgi:hypothetical protein